MGIGRNEPCPCGSGLKYKKCCLGKEAPKRGAAGGEASGPFRFEPGSYGGPGAYMPSLACLRETPAGESEYHFVITRYEKIFGQEDDAVAQAAADFAEARQAGGDSDEDLARHLAALGYIRVKDPRIIEENA